MTLSMTDTKILIINPRSLTDWDGKSLRLVRFARALQAKGKTVSIWTSENLSRDLEFEVLVPPKYPNFQEYFGSHDYAALSSELRNAESMARRVVVPLVREILSKEYRLI